MQLFKRNKLNSKGFGHVELVVAVFVIAGIGLTGFFVNSHRPNQTHAATPRFEYMGYSLNGGRADAIWACRSSDNLSVTFKQSWGATNPPSYFWFEDHKNTPTGPLYGNAYIVTTGNIYLPWITLAVSPSNTNWLEWSINYANWVPAGLVREGQLAVC